MEFTQDTSEYLHTHATGYMVNTPLSKTTQRKIKTIQNAFEDRFAHALWSPPSEALHITLLDWLAPLVEYHKTKDELFEERFATYDAAMHHAIANTTDIEIHFDSLLVSPTAIALVADHTSTQSINEIRRKFIARVDLLPGTKQPPTIVHSTIARFVGPIALDDVRAFAQTLDISVNETIQSFQLVRESVLPMLDYSEIKRYLLN